MSKHTPGPWKMGHAITSDQIAIAPGDTKDGDIATPICLVSPVDKYTDTDEANAKLISAAPDLLEAALDFVNKVETGRARSTDSYNKFKEAIKKATT